MTEGADIPVASIVSFVPHAHLGFATKHRHRVLGESAPEAQGADHAGLGVDLAEFNGWTQGTSTC